MLAVKTYPQAHIDACRTLMHDQIASYRAAVGPTNSVKTTEFETRLANHLVVVLDAYFMHRTRAIEGKDGNPINEVRMLASSVISNGGVLAGDSTIKYDPDRAILGAPIGGVIAPTVDEFERLADAYFDEIESRFT